MGMLYEYDPEDLDRLAVDWSKVHDYVHEGGDDE